MISFRTSQRACIATVVVNRKVESNGHDRRGTVYRSAPSYEWVAVYDAVFIAVEREVLPLTRVR